ncbi:hypothetical protein ACFLT7_02655 [candidate division KSB1 bacterium]
MKQKKQPEIPAARIHFNHEDRRRILERTDRGSVDRLVEALYEYQKD